MTDEFITITEICRITSLSRPTVRKMLRDGRMAGLVLVYGFSRVQRKTFEAWRIAQDSKDRGKSGKVGNLT